MTYEFPMYILREHIPQHFLDRFDSTNYGPLAFIIEDERGWWGWFDNFPDQPVLFKSKELGQVVDREV